MVQTVAIIPARGGSKRIPKKNIKDFFGKPAISWPIAAASMTGLFDRIVVSTDDDGIAEVARRAGAEVPFLRSPELSDDYSGTTEVVRDCVQRLDLSGDAAVCCIYATALFVRGSDISAGHGKLLDGADWVLSVAEYPTPIDRAYKAEGDRLMPRQPDMMPKRSQDLEPAFFDVGQFYWARASKWLETGARVWDGAAGVRIPFGRAIDIDTPDDWTRAERLFELLQADS